MGTLIGLFIGLCTLVYLATYWLIIVPIATIIGMIIIFICMCANVL